MEFARGSRERSQLRAHAGLAGEYFAETLGMWQEDRRADLEPGFYRYKTAFMASFDVKTAVDVARPEVVSMILSLTGVHGHVATALLGRDAGCSRLGLLRKQ